MAEQDNLSEPGAFGQLYREHGSRIRSFLRLSVGNSSAADDLTQESFLDLWSRPASRKRFQSYRATAMMVPS
ncbi:MAG: RNA polymerase sigma factor [Bryobacteraceae bacterium]